ncbi:hypothetical protein AAMO2058_001498900 [Amorphochlora amoebiformis]
MVFEEASKTSSLPEVSSQTKEKTVEVFDDQKHGVVLADSNQIITHCNSMFVELTGYNVNDVIGKNCRILQGKNTDQKTVEFIRAALKRGEGCQVMILNYRKNGVPFWNRLSIQPLLDKHGRIRKFVGIQIERSLPVSRFAPVMPWKVGIKKEGPRLLTVASESAVKESGELQILEEKKSKPKISLHDVSFVAETNLPTIKGKYRVRAYKDNKTRQEIMCIIWGKIEASSGLHVRAHDQCFTSEVLGSLKCDCKQQLDFAMEHIKKTSGMVIYLPQEGRGMGLAHKIKAYAVQEHGYDTVDAQHVLGFPDDSRTYAAIPGILQEMNIKSIKLMTNNPRKIRHLKALGIQIDSRIPIVTPTNKHSEGYLKTKHHRQGHMNVGEDR